MAAIGLGAVTFDGCNRGSFGSSNDAQALTSDGAAESAAALSPSASSSAVEASPVAPSASALDASAPGPVTHHRGVVGTFFRAVQNVDLTDDQKTAIAKLEDPIRNEPASRHEANAFHADLAASIKANRIDMSKLHADEAAIAKAYAARQDEQAIALNSLHAILNADQRRTVVEALRGAHASHDRPSGLLENDAGASEWVARRVERMKAQLFLDLDQRREVAAVVAKNGPPSPAILLARVEAGKKQMTALLDAFEKDAFDAKKMDLTLTQGKRPTEGLERQVTYIGQLLPVLTAGQRDRLAALVERPRDHARGDSIAEPFDTGSPPILR